ncbi:MAG: hypothetical protein LBJ02_11720 [Bifidobacteriaceae bacterium]|jgi:uncharacterized protein YjbI with pentapeptide repeats|nr:hypothetical protein [Bifidobacteriaceae bacterium]
MGDDAERGVYDRGDRLDVCGARLRGRDFSGRRLTNGFLAVASRFEDCKFDGILVDSLAFGAGSALSEYVGCSFDGASLAASSGDVARFVRCSFENVRIRDWYCWEVEFVDCVFSGVLRNVVFDGQVPEMNRGRAGRDVNEFIGNDFSRADLRGVTFRGGIDLGRQRLPEGGDYTHLSDDESSWGCWQWLADWR